MTEDSDDSAASSSMIANALGSATAGIVGRICTHPLDTAKARLQAVYNSGGDPSAAARRSTKSCNPYRGPIDVLHKTFRKEGIKGLYRGFGAVIVGGTPGTVIYLCTYEAAKERLSRMAETESGSGSGDDFFVHFSSGMFAGKDAHEYAAQMPFVAAII